MVDGLPNVAFKTPVGKYVCIVLNKETAIRNIAIRWQNQTADVSIPANSVATYTW
jgi:glucosylceramidase